mgnify:CR=1 FL=1
MWFLYVTGTQISDYYLNLLHVATLEPTMIFIHKCTNIHNSSIRNMVHKINNISIEIIVQINGNR